MAPLATVAAGVVLTIFVLASVDAFAPVISTRSHRHDVTPYGASTRHQHSSSSPIILQMTEEENTADDTTATTEGTDEQPEEQVELDPEVVALKDQITSLESDLKAKRSQLSNLNEMADKYSSTGYARQVALVENNKRLRRGSMADGKSAARATVLQSFLPVLDELDVIGPKYEGVAFAKTLDAGLRSELENSLGELGVSEYAVESGQAMDVGRVVAVEEEYSEEFAKGTVIRPLKSGLEISGNAIRPAEVVGSLGSESDAAAEGDGDEGSGEDAGEQ